MHPDVTLALMRKAISDGDYEEAGKRAEDLDIWIKRGGFLPTGWLHNPPED